MIECKLFEEMEAPFWAHGVGAMCWATLTTPDPPQSVKALYLVTPNLIDGDPKGILTCLYVEHADNNWAQPGGVRGWDGNEERPTLTSSIQVLHGKGVAEKGWHGWLEDGKLRDA